MPHPGEITKFVWFKPIHHMWSHNLSLWNHPIPLCPPTSSKTCIYHVKLKLRFKCPNPKHGYQISHPHENYDNQFSSTTERKSVKCPGYAQKGEGRGVLKLQFGRYEEQEKLLSKNLQGGHTHSLCSRVLMLNPNVGSIVLISSPLNFFKIVVLPALSRPLSTVSRKWHQY